MNMSNLLQSKLYRDQVAKFNAQKSLVFEFKLSAVVSEILMKQIFLFGTFLSLETTS